MANSTIQICTSRMIGCFTTSGISTCIIPDHQLCCILESCTYTGGRITWVQQDRLLFQSSVSIIPASRLCTDCTPLRYTNQYPQVRPAACMHSWALAQTGRRQAAAWQNGQCAWSTHAVHVATPARACVICTFSQVSVNSSARKPPDKPVPQFRWSATSLRQHTPTGPSVQSIQALAFPTPQNITQMKPHGAVSPSKTQLLCTKSLHRHAHCCCTESVPQDSQ